MSNLNNDTVDLGITAQPIDTITVTSVDLSSINLSTLMSSTVTIPSSFTISSTGNVGIGSISPTTWQWLDSKPFENSFPEWNDFQEMCKEYPGLEKAFDHLKVFYKLCKDEWESKKKGDV